MYFERIKHLKPYKTETTPCKIKLSSNESPFDLSLKLKERISDEIKKLNLQRYPDPTSSELKEVLSNFYGVSPENLVLGNGSDELIHLLITIIGNYNQPVMYPIPTFPMYQVSADIVGRKKVEFPLNKDFQIEKDKIDKALKQKPILSFFASPNNPTGNSFDKELIKYVSNRNVFTVVDEAYIDFSDKEDFVNEALNSENLVVLRTMSKIGLAGIRLGILIAKKEVAQEIDKARPPFNITSPTQVIGKIVLTEGRDEIKEHIRVIKEERDKMYKELNQIKGIKVFPSDANFILVKVPNGNEIHKKLIKNGILVRNMSHLPMMENSLRISIGKPEENAIFIETFKNLLEGNNEF